MLTGSLRAASTGDRSRISRAVGCTSGGPTAVRSSTATVESVAITIQHMQADLGVMDRPERLPHSHAGSGIGTVHAVGLVDRNNSLPDGSIPRIFPGMPFHHNRPPRSHLTDSEKT